MRVIDTNSEAPRTPPTIAITRAELGFVFNAVGISVADGGESERELVVDAKKVDIVDDEKGVTNDRSTTASGA